MIEFRGRLVKITEDVSSEHVSFIERLAQLADGRDVVIAERKRTGLEARAKVEGQWKQYENLVVQRDRFLQPVLLDLNKHYLHNLGTLQAEPSLDCVRKRNMPTKGNMPYLYDPTVFLKWDCKGRHSMSSYSQEGEEVSLGIKVNGDILVCFGDNKIDTTNNPINIADSDWRVRVEDLIIEAISNGETHFIRVETTDGGM